MKLTSSKRVFDSCFDNWKSKTCTEPFDSAAQDKLRRSIQNIKWLVVAESFPLGDGDGCRSTEVASGVNGSG